MEKNKERAFIVVWCCEGLEWVEDVTGRDAKNMWGVLKGDEPKAFSDMLKMTIMRARLNPQRFYEIYSITAIDGIKGPDIVKMFNMDPQGAAEIIREKGHQIYSDRETKEKVIS